MRNYCFLAALIFFPRNGNAYMDENQAYMERFIQTLYATNPGFKKTLASLSVGDITRKAQQLADSIIFQQALKYSTDTQSVIRKEKYQNILKGILERDQKKLRPLVPVPQPAIALPAPPAISASKPMWDLEKPDTPRWELLDLEAHKREEERRSRSLKWKEAGPSTKELTQALYDEVSHWVYVLGHYPQLLYLDDKELESIIEVINSDFTTEEMKIQKLWEHLQSMEDKNRALVSKVRKIHRNKNQWLNEDVPDTSFLPGTSKTRRPNQAWEFLVRRIARMQPLKAEELNVYVYLSLVTVTEIFLKLIQAQTDSTVLSQALSDLDYLKETWHPEVFTNLSIFYSKVSPTLSKEIELLLSDLMKNLEVVLKNPDSWNKICQHCEKIYQKNRHRIQTESDSKKKNP